jgi:hypothetical protein
MDLYPDGRRASGKEKASAHGERGLGLGHRQGDSVALLQAQRPRANAHLVEEMGVALVML